MEKYREGLFARVASMLRAYGIPEEDEFRLQEELSGQKKQLKPKSKKQPNQHQQSTMGDYM